MGKEKKRYEIGPVSFILVFLFFQYIAFSTSASAQDGNLIPCVYPNDFCEGEATDNNVNEFVYDGLPEGYSYKWAIDGTEREITLDYLNSLAPGSHNAKINIYYSKNYVTSVGDQWITVGEKPVATITPF